MITTGTPAVGTELVLDGKECIVVDPADTDYNVWCSHCALSVSTCLPIKREAKIACSGVIFMPKLEYLKRQMRGEL